MGHRGKQRDHGGGGLAHLEWRGWKGRHTEHGDAVQVGVERAGSLFRWLAWEHCHDLAHC